MIQRIKTSKSAKVVSCYLAIQLVVSMIYPSQLFALTGGPAQPEFNAFTPIGTSDMVSLSSGDFGYNIPVLDVGGYPLNLSYSSGVTMDQEASWVGLGWNLNVGQINRQVRGIPDDFDGDELRYQNNMRTNFTAGIDTGIRFPLFGFDFLNLGVGLGIKYNNYDGFTPNTNFGASFDISDQVSAGLNITSTAGDGASVTPTVGFTSKKKEVDENIFSSFTSSLGVPFNSRQGVKGLNLSTSLNRFQKIYNKEKKDYEYKQTSSGNISGSLSFNDNLLFNPKNELSFFNANLTINFGLGTEIFGSEGPQGHVTGYGSIQKLRNVDKDKKVKAYGYANTENASPLNAVLDFNRENDRTVSKNTTMLPLTNQTYDLYSIQAQGVGGMFRPHRNQVGFVFDQTTTSFGIGASTGGEIGPGLGTHLGANIKVNPSFSRSGLWIDGTNTVLPNFILNNNSSNSAYEPVYYKFVGELNADSEPGFFNDLHGKSPMKIDIGGSKFNRKTKNKYKVKGYASNNAINYSTHNLSSAKRDNRVPRTSAVQMVTKAQMDVLPDGQIRTNTLPSAVPANHQIGVKVFKENGSTYVFGETAYNTKKVEATFAVNNTGDCLTGLVNYTPGSENSTNNNSGRDKYFNRIETPAYAHSYLLTSVLSKDYEDLTNNGPTDDDLGAYTRFNYETPTNYGWRVPFQQNKATYSEGMNTDSRDNKGNYVYGEKEVKYIESIETKTHIAIFHKSNRKDAYGVDNENGNNNATSSRMMKLDKIALYSKPEYDLNPGAAKPIKEVYFEYRYDLCKNVPNNFSGVLTPNEISNNGGKLTLDKVYFTYRDSNMGKYTPYAFNYEGLNPDYDLKGYDVWGGYKPVTGNCNLATGDATVSEFPFTEQDKVLQDDYTSAWTLTSVDLPSGGKIEVEYESDDYGYVQDKSVMQMFKVVGAGTSNNTIQGQQLYNGNSEERNYLYVQIPNGTSTNQFVDKYLRDIGNSDRNPLYFKFMLNMTSSASDYDYVSGYALIDNKIPGNGVNVFSQGGNTYAAILLKEVKREGGIINSNQKVNPVAKAGWYFGRKHLNRQVYGVDAPDIDEPSDLLDLALSFKNSIGAIGEIFTGPNKALRNKGCAKFFNPKRSWIRLYQPENNKLGGGCRVKKIQMQDNWDIMTDNLGDSVYKNFYGQEYSYLNEQGKTSGVATFEPNGSKENPLVLPFYDKPQKLIAPKESNYVEKPIGQSLYPSPSVTYGRVVVKNLQRERNDGGTNVTLKKHATGEVITEFYTSKDFPTISDYTDITPKVDVTGILGSILKVRTGKSLTYSQGFSIQTNDMNGKQKSQTIKAEGQGNNEFISKVEYKYATDQSGRLNNNLSVINKDGTVSTRQLGVTQDVINDFRSSTSESTVLGANGNLGAIFVFLGLIPVPTIFPVIQRHEEELKTAVTTKLIHTTGILKEKIAYDLGSRVSTRNLAWDGETGNLLLTETVNEFDDNYYSLNYPGYWYYKNMGAASNNLNFSGIIEQVGSGSFNRIKDANGNTITNILTLGDQLIVSEPISGGNVNTERLWVVQINSSGQVKLIDDSGTLVSGLAPDTSFFIYHSGYRNEQMGSMATVTSQVNPTTGGQINTLPNWVTLDIVSANAIEYSDAWDSQCEFRLPDSDNVLDILGNLNNVDNLNFNPFLYNVKNEWRSVKSYAYLDGRNNGTQGYHPREEGFFESYTPFYKRSGNTWVKDDTNWTFASQITQFSPYGMEIENKDALDRFSAAQYGYRYTLPTAIGSNTEYKEMAFDGFEDYDYAPLNGNSSNPINPHFGYFDEVITNANATIIESTSHSGRNSLRVNPNASAVARYRIIDCNRGGGGVPKLEDNVSIKNSNEQNTGDEKVEATIINNKN